MRKHALHFDTAEIWVDAWAAAWWLLGDRSPALFGGCAI